MSAALNMIDNEGQARLKQLAAHNVLFADRGAWLDERKSYLGGTDIAAIVNRNRWKTPFGVYEDKVLDKGDTAGRHAELGLLMEHLIDKWVLEETGQVAYAVGLVRHPEHPFLAVNIDRILESGAIAEYKTFGYSSEKEWGPEPEGPIPLHYEVQCQMQMGITGASVAYVFGVHRDRLTLGCWEVAFDADLYELLVAAGVRFWNDHVLPQVPPALEPRDADRVGDLPRTGTVAEGTDQDTVAVNRAVEILGIVDPLNKELAAIKDDLKVRYRTFNQLLTDAGTVKFRFAKRDTTDWKGLCAHLAVPTEKIKEFTKATNVVSVILPKE